MDDEVYGSTGKRPPRAAGPTAPKAPVSGGDRGFSRFTLPGMEFDGDNAGPAVPSMPLPPGLDLLAGLFGAVTGVKGEKKGLAALAGLGAGQGGQNGSGGASPASRAGPPAEAGAAGQAPRPAGDGSSLGRKALASARNEIGVKEEPKGSNRGPRVDLYTGGKSQPWCSHFVSWCVEQNGQSPFGHLASVASLRKWGKNNGRYRPVGSGTPAPGDIFTMARYDKAGKLVGGHTGFVASVAGGGATVGTVEGNSGDRVKEGRRSLDSLDGFIRL